MHASLFTCPFSRNQKILPFFLFHHSPLFIPREREKIVPLVGLVWIPCGSLGEEREDRARKSRGLKPKKFVDRPRWWSKMVVISCFLAQEGRGRGEKSVLCTPPARLGRLIALEGRLITDRIKRKKKRERERWRREEETRIFPLSSRGGNFFLFLPPRNHGGSCV